jgi:thiol-disulfide isomerase/thioredoxin
MQIPSIAALALLAFQSPGRPGSGDFAVLSREYEVALSAHKTQLERLKGAARAEQAERTPAAQFWDRFGALAEAGEGRAVFWMARHARERGAAVPAPEGRAQAKRLYGELVDGWAEADWFGKVVDQLGDERALLGSQELERIYRVVLEKNPERAVQAQALAGLALELSRQKTPEAEREADELRGRLAKDYADTEPGARAARKLAVAVGSPAPEFTGRTIDGQEFKLSDYRGKVVLLDFYGFWCAPCRASLGHLRELAELHGEKPFAIIGVNHGDGPAAYKRGLEEHGITWTSAYQGPRAEISELYDIRSYPTFFLLDRQGVIAAKGHSSAEVAAEIERLLAE